MKKDCECETHCGDVATDRMRYFTGRYMTARDFRDEQAYHLTHRYLHNRMLHGWGVGCGLHVHPHPDPDCQGSHVLVDCGMAIDCCGREIVVPRAIVPPPIVWTHHPAHEPPPSAPPPPPHGYQPPPQDEKPPDEPQRPDHDRDHRRCWLLCLEYCEEEIEVVPVLYSEHSCDAPRSEHGRVRDSYKFKWHPIRIDELPKFHWKTPGGGCVDRDDRTDEGGNGHDHPKPHDEKKPDEAPKPYEPAKSSDAAKPYEEPKGSAGANDHEAHRRPYRPCPDDDCDQPGGHHHRCCLDPYCPPDHCVPLALVCVRPGHAIAAEDIQTIGRPTLRAPQHELTHVCGINWMHGGVVARRHLERHLRRLEIRFDRRLQKSDAQPGDCGPFGVNPCTFVVQFGGGYEDLDFVTYSEPPHVEHDCVAVFTIDPRSHKGHHDLPYAYLEHHTVFITLKCNFIRDCHGDPVDGDHLNGILPSGDGIRGGTFESWFRVVPDHEWDRYQQEQRV